MCSITSLQITKSNLLFNSNFSHQISQTKKSISLFFCLFNQILISAISIQDNLILLKLSQINFKSFQSQHQTSKILLNFILFKVFKIK
ncbi:TPA: hypothetical protein DCZ31_05260 [Patescibacteria group bacterium]|nr:hypothetical protein [Candidatus Gracilibacteria bacterium]